MKTASVNKFRFVSSIITFSGVLILGIVFLAVFFILKKDVPANYIETNAKIIRIEKELSPFYDESDGLDESDYDHQVFVEYSYNDETYTDVEYPNYNSDMKEGDTVLLYLNPDNPEEFMGDPSGDSVFVIIVAVFILIGAGGLGYTIYKKKKGE